MSRTRVLKPELIETVKKTIQIRGFRNQLILAENIGVCRATVSSFLNGRLVLYENAEKICEALGLDLIKSTDAGPSTFKEKPIFDSDRPPGSSDLSAREQELSILEEKICSSRCRLILIAGMKGMGKTNLSYHIGTRVREHFDVVIWRSIDHFSSLNELLIDLLEVFSKPNIIEIPKTIKKRLNSLKTNLETRKCLLILANVNSFLHNYSFSENCPDCGDLLKWIVEKQENSCVIMTSDVQPKEIDFLSSYGNQKFYRLNIEPLDIRCIKNIFSEIGTLKAIKMIGKS